MSKTYDYNYNGDVVEVKSPQCRWLVWRGYGYGDTHCERKAGHGTDKAFCKQHAKMAGKKK